MTPRVLLPLSRRVRYRRGGRHAREPAYVQPAEGLFAFYRSPLHPVLVKRSVMLSVILTAEIHLVE